LVYFTTIDNHLSSIIYLKPVRSSSRSDAMNLAVRFNARKTGIELSSRRATIEKRRQVSIIALRDDGICHAPTVRFNARLNSNHRSRGENTLFNYAQA